MRTARGTQQKRKGVKQIKRWKIKFISWKTSRQLSGISSGYKILKSTTFIFNRSQIMIYKQVSKVYSCKMRNERFFFPSLVYSLLLLCCFCRSDAPFARWSRKNQLEWNWLTLLFLLEFAPCVIRCRRRLR